MRNDEYTGDFTPEERERWEEMKREPMRAIIVTKEEFEKLKKEGRI